MVFLLVAGSGDRQWLAEHVVGLVVYIVLVDEYLDKRIQVGDRRRVDSNSPKQTKSLAPGAGFHLNS